MVPQDDVGSNPPLPSRFACFPSNSPLPSRVRLSSVEVCYLSSFLKGESRIIQAIIDLHNRQSVSRLVLPSSLLIAMSWE